MSGYEKIANMDKLYSYRRIVDGIFGKGTIKSQSIPESPNVVVGAFNMPSNFRQFICNFRARLERLYDIYGSDPSGMNQLKVQLNELIDRKKWRGAFAELAAYDYMNQDLYFHKGCLTKPVKLNVSLPSNRTLASNFRNRSTANIDGNIEETRTWFDVKILEDISDNILSGIYEETRRKLKTNEFSVLASYSREDHKKIESNRTALLKEFALHIESKGCGFRSKVVPDLTFSVGWGEKVLTSVESYSPYKHAEETHFLAFKNADQFMKEEPFFLVYVMFPWFNQIVRPFRETNRLFYRSFARRVFCQYLHSDLKYCDRFPEYHGSETIFDASKCLSGIIFLQDESIDGVDTNSLNTKSYIYFNPNANNSAKQGLFQELLQEMHITDLDDFEHDNY